MDNHRDGASQIPQARPPPGCRTIIFDTPCGTAPWFVVDPSVNTGTYTVDRLLVSGGGYSFRHGVAGSVTGLRIVDRSWVYGPLDSVDCSSLSSWDAQLVTIDANYQVTRVVGDLPCE